MKSFFTQNYIVILLLCAVAITNKIHAQNTTPRNGLVPPSHFSAMSYNDFGYLISGDQKLVGGDIDIEYKVTKPSLNGALTLKPFKKIKDLRIGGNGKVELRDFDYTNIQNTKVQYSGKLSVIYLIWNNGKYSQNTYNVFRAKVNSDSTTFKANLDANIISNDIKIKMMKSFLDSIYTTDPPFNSKKYLWASGGLELKNQDFKTYSYSDTAVLFAPEDFKDITKTIFKFSLVSNFYHYINNSGNFKNLDFGGSKYLKFGVEYALNNAQDIYDNNGQKFQKTDSTQKGIIKVKDDFTAYKEQDFSSIHSYHFFFEYNLILTNRKFGFKLAHGYKNAFNYKVENLYSEAGVFGTLRNPFRKLDKYIKDKTIVNFRVSLLFNNLTDKPLFQYDGTKNMSLTYKLELPFPMLGKK